MENVRIYPYNMGSESAKQLAEMLEVSRVYSDGRYSPKSAHFIINWGSSTVPNWYAEAMRRGTKVLNKPESVAMASNKLKTFQALERAGIMVPKFTTSRSVAQEWLDADFTVVERHELQGNSGSGIRLVSAMDESLESELTSAPLYTKYIPKKKEFRVHVFRGQVFDYAQKRKRRTEERPANFNKYICSTEMGWLFCKTDIEHIQAVKDIAVRAVSALGLDFAAVDIIYHKDRAYVLEVNTAPGMAPSTLRSYVDAVKGYIGASGGTTLTREAATRTVATPTVGGDMVTFSISRTAARELHSILSRFV